MRTRSKITKRFRRFLGCPEEGSVAVEFVLAAPILIGSIIIPSEFGKALYITNAMEQGTREAARYLSRAPLDASDNFYAIDLTTAQNMITNRLAVADSDKAVSIQAMITLSPTVGGEALRTDFQLLEVQAAAEVQLPFWSVLKLFKNPRERDVKVILATRDQTRYFGD